MFRMLVAAAALCAASGVSAAVDFNMDDGYAANTFVEQSFLEQEEAFATPPFVEQAAPIPLEQTFYPSFTGTAEAIDSDVPLRLGLEDYLVIFKGERPSSFPSEIGYVFGDENIDNSGLTFDQTYLLTTVSSSIDDRVRGIVWLDNGLAMTPQDYAAEYVNVPPVPEPHEWAMIVAGMGVVGFVAKRRKLSAVEE